MSSGACEAEFMGGPADGMLRAFPGDEQPAKVVLPMQISMTEYTEVVYVRQVSQMDEGPLWVFVPAPVLNEGKT